MTDTPTDRRITWGVVAFECLHVGHVEWAADAFKYSQQKSPPRTWPIEHPASRPDLADPPGWGMKLLGRALIQAIKIRTWLRGVR